MKDLMSMIRYFAFVISEGDWLNDWLTHLPLEIRDETRILGEWLANIFAL